MAKKKIVQGGGVVVFGQHVVLRRTKSGKWIFPKGHVDRGETTEQTARREVEEETGLRVEVLEPLGQASYKSDDEKVTVEYFLMRVHEPGPRWDQHRNVDSFLIPPEQVAAHLSTGQLRRLWERHQARIEQLLQPEQA